jgi:PST family polysaccharide transporter
MEQFMPPIEAVFVPTLARLQSQPARYRRTVLQVFETIALASFLFAGLLLALSHPLTLLVLGQKWEKAAPIFASFTFVALYSPLGGISTWLLTSQGRGKDFLRLSVITSSATVIAFLLGLRYGPSGVAFAFSISCLLVVMPVQFWIAGRQGPVSTWDLWSRFFTHLPLWAVVCLTTFLARREVLDLAPWKQIVICASAGLAAGILFISVYTPARRAALNLVRVVRESMQQGTDT